MRDKEIVIRVRLPHAFPNRWLIGVSALIALGALAYAAVPYSFGTGDRSPPIR